MLSEMLKASQHQQLKYRYTLFDIWFLASETPNFIVETVKKHFVSIVKANRQVAMSEADKQARRQGILYLIGSDPN